VTEPELLKSNLNCEYPATKLVVPPLVYWTTPSHETVFADHTFLIKSATVGVTGVGVTGVGFTGVGSLFELQAPKN
jgi:hypothetical protein